MIKTMQFGKSKYRKRVLYSCGVFLAAGMFFVMGFGAEAKEKVPRSEVMLKPIGINSIMDPEKSEY